MWQKAWFYFFLYKKIYFNSLINQNRFCTKHTIHKKTADAGFKVWSSLHLIGQMILFWTLICLMKYNFILIGQIICWSVGFLLARRCIFGLRVSDRISLELQIFSVCSNSLKVPGLCGKIGTKWKQNQKNIFFNDFWFTASNVKHNILWWLSTRL